MDQDITIVTEGNFNAKILEKILLAREFKMGYQILPAHGYSSALSKVKSLLTIANKKVILILDTDTVNKNEIREKEEFVNSYININLNDFKIFFAVPEIEVIFLNNKEFLKRLPRNIISEDILNNEQFINIARTAPKKTLEGFFNISRDSLIDFLNTKEILDEFYSEGLIKEIFDYMSNETVSNKRFAKR